MAQVLSYEQRTARLARMSVSFNAIVRAHDALGREIALMRKQLTDEMDVVDYATRRLDDIEDLCDALVEDLGDISWVHQLKFEAGRPATAGNWQAQDLDAGAFESPAIYIDYTQSKESIAPHYFFELLEEGDTYMVEDSEGGLNDGVFDSDCQQLAANPQFIDGSFTYWDTESDSADPTIPSGTWTDAGAGGVAHTASGATAAYTDWLSQLNEELLAFPEAVYYKINIMVTAATAGDIGASFAAGGAFAAAGVTTIYDFSADGAVVTPTIFTGYVLGATEADFFLAVTDTFAGTIAYVEIVPAGVFYSDAFADQGNNRDIKLTLIDR